MLMPSRWARRTSPYWNTVSILCLRFQFCPNDGPYWNEGGKGGSRLDADFRLGGGSLLDADYHSGLRNIFPLEMRLGLTAGRATPALMERVGRASAQHTQKTVLEWLQQDHNVQWSAETLRKV